MLKKWIDKVLPTKQPKPKRRVVEYEEHGIHADMLSFAAEKVVKRLQQEGYQAYVVGGAVRDLLLGKEPKDFDVATNATPEQIRKVFRRSRIIGRRFQIVHVMIGPETIEVTTFRGYGKVHQNEHGRIMRDNTYGNIEQDATRRDFTCNALYYDPTREQIIDYHHGIEDIRCRQLVMIGDPASRYQEDPVRILRAVRLSGKLGFYVEENTAALIPQYAPLLAQEPVARLFDEIMKLLFSGQARQCLNQLHTLEVGDDIHPLLSAMQQNLQEKSMISLALRNTDERLKADKSVSVGFVLAAVLWSHLQSKWLYYQEQGQKSAAAMNIAIAEFRETLEKGWGVPQRFSATMREIWVLQPQFHYQKGARPYKLLRQPRFRAAFDFLVLRSWLGEVEPALAEWWQIFQHADENTQAEMVQMKASGVNELAESSLEPKANKKRRRRPRKRKENRLSEH